MSNKQEKKNKTAEKIGKNMTRPERWGVHARAYLAKMKGNECAVPAEWLEEIEGRPLDEVIVDRLVELRGWGATNPTIEQKIHLETDEAYEAAGTRSRNANEDSVVHIVAWDYLARQAHLIDSEDLHTFIKRFYSAGDCGLCQAVHRAVKFALSVEARA